MKNLDSFSSVISKIVIFVPIVILIIALILKFNQTTSSLTSNINFSLSPTTASALKKINFDLNGPYHCLYNTNSQIFEGYIKNKNILLKITQGKTTKKYLLTPYASIIEGFLNGDLKTIQTMASQYLKKEVDLQTIISSCKKEDFNESIFKE